MANLQAEIYRHTAPGGMYAAAESLLEIAKSQRGLAEVFRRLTKGARNRQPTLRILLTMADGQ